MTKIDRRNFLKLLPLVPLSLTLKNTQGHRRSVSSHSEQRKPNVLILLLDTLSARHTFIYGYHRETTPNIARFAERSTVYHAHYAAGNFTTPGTASLLTGEYPWAHRALHAGGEIIRGHEHHNLFKLFGDTHFRLAYPHNWVTHTLFHRFREHIDVYLPPEEFCLSGGILPDQSFPNDATVASRSFDDLLFRDLSSPGSFFLAFAYKLKMLMQEQGWRKELGDLYPRGVPTLSRQKWSFLLEHIFDGVMAAIDSLPQPFLAYFHLFPPHEPYRPHRDFVGIFNDGQTPVAKDPHVLSPGLSQEMLDQWRVEYDEYLAFTDAEFGRVYDFMDKIGIFDNTYVILTSDHGQLFERGVHGHVTELLYEPIIHVPLLISRPGQQQREDIYTPTSCVDLMPTLLNVTGQTIPDWCEGELLPTTNDRPNDAERSIFSVEAKSNPIHQPLTKGTIALIRGQYKLIHYRGYDGYEQEYELYDLANDPEELEDLYPSKGSIAMDLQQELEQKLQEINRPYDSQSG